MAGSINKEKLQGPFTTKWVRRSRLHTEGLLGILHILQSFETNSYEKPQQEPIYSRGREQLSDLDKLDGFAAAAFDHDGAQIAKFVGLLEESNSFAAQLCQPGFEIGHTEREVVHQMPARAHKGLFT